MDILVVPTIRKDCILNFLNKWEGNGDWDKIIIVEDNPTCTFDIKGIDFHYSWEDIEKDLGKDSWIISKRDSAIRTYGFYKAYQLGADYIFSLDDDCMPYKKDFCKSHKENMLFEKWMSLIPDVRTRGLPYKNKGMLKCVANVGLWRGIPDFDAVTSLANGVPENFDPQSKKQIIPNGVYFPFCGMNMAFHKSIIPLAYFPLMGQNQKYSRFDDIWFGIILKKICDHLRLNISYGHPEITHKKASNMFVNLIKEASGIYSNETFWETIDQIKLTKNNPKDCMAEIGDGLLHLEDEYLSNLGKAILIWISFFN